MVAKNITDLARDLKRYQGQQISDDDFTAARLLNGVYGQRQNDNYMIRVKVPGGELTREQLTHLGELARQFTAVDFVNITTRQDIQLHFVPLENVIPVLQGLDDVGLTTREACGNTVRNITACPLAGVCPSEHLDVRPLLRQTVDHFLYHPLTQHLPRKFKMSFSGCEQDCAQGMIHDLGVVATQQDGRAGFKILVGGGLGHKPHEAIQLESCLPPQLLQTAIEAVVAIHHRHSNRKHRAKARIKFLVAKLGAERFKVLYQTEFERLQKRQSQTKIDTLHWLPQRTVIPANPGAPQTNISQRQRGRFSIPVRIPLGDLTLVQVNNIGRIMRKYELNALRTTQDQNLLLTDVSESDINPIEQELQGLGVNGTNASPQPVACPGTWSCRLGITDSRAMAKQITPQKLPLRINVSGCHNGCAQPTVSDIGMHGEAKRRFGKLIPHYQLHLGGDATHGGRIGRKGPSIPVIRTPQAVRRIHHAYLSQSDSNLSFTQWVQQQPKAYFSELLEDLAAISADDAGGLAKDLAAEETFSVASLGGGECAGIKEETRQAALAEIHYEREYCQVFGNLGQTQDLIDGSLRILEISGNLMVQRPRNSPQIPLRELISTISQSSDYGSAGEVFNRILNLLSEPVDIKELIKTIDALAQLIENPSSDRNDGDASLTHFYSPKDIQRVLRMLDSLSDEEDLSIVCRAGRASDVLANTLRSREYAVDQSPHHADAEKVTLIVARNSADFHSSPHKHKELVL